MTVAQSGASRGKVVVLGKGMKFHEVGVTNRDAQFLESRKFKITGIARLFRLPSHLIADLGAGDVLEHRAAEVRILDANDDAMGRALGGQHRVRVAAPFDDVVRMVRRDAKASAKPGASRRAQGRDALSNVCSKG